MKSKVLIAIILVLIGIPIIRYLFTGIDNVYDLNVVFNTISNAPTIPTDWFFELNRDGIPGLDSSWGAFDFLRYFIIYQLDQYLFIGWIGAGILNSVLYISYFIMFIFGVF